MQQSRRTVVRAGVWAVPAVSLSAVAPAYATVSGGGGRLSIVNASFITTTNTYTDWRVAVDNSGPGTVAAGTLTFTIRGPASVTVSLSPSPPASTGWTGPTAGANGTWVFTYSLVLPGTGAVKTTNNLYFRLTDNTPNQTFMFGRPAASGFTSPPETTFDA